MPGSPGLPGLQVQEHPRIPLAQPGTLWEWRGDFQHIMWMSLRPSGPALLIPKNAALHKRTQHPWCWVWLWQMETNGVQPLVVTSPCQSLGVCVCVFFFFFLSSTVTASGEIQSPGLGCLIYAAAAHREDKPVSPMVSVGTRLEWGHQLYRVPFITASSFQPSCEYPWPLIHLPAAVSAWATNLDLWEVSPGLSSQRMEATPHVF